MLPALDEGAVGDDHDEIPDVRDGLTRRERIVLRVLSELQVERAGRNVPVAQLYGRVVEEIDLSKEELQLILTRLGAASNVTRS